MIAKEILKQAKRAGEGGLITIDNVEYVVNCLILGLFRKPYYAILDHNWKTPKKGEKPEIAKCSIVVGPSMMI